MTSGKPLILVGIGGGIAAYKAAFVVSELSRSGLDLHVAMTQSAVRFITPLTFEALTGRSVHREIFPSGVIAKREDCYPHLYPATQTDLFIVLPANS